MPTQHLHWKDTYRAAAKRSTVLVRFTKSGPASFCQPQTPNPNHHRCQEPLRATAYAVQRHAAGATVGGPHVAFAGHATGGEDVDAGNVGRMSRRVSGHPGRQQPAHQRPGNERLDLHGDF